MKRLSDEWKLAAARAEEKYRQGLDETRPEPHEKNAWDVEFVHRRLMEEFYKHSQGRG